jgi:cytochrome c-type biogenesis protein CcmH
MILWMILTILCSAAAVMVAAPFLRTYGEHAKNAGADLQVYRDQLNEVEREAKTGLIDETQADGARAEIRRRLLLADRRISDALKGTSLAGNQTAIIGVTGVVVLGSVILYAMSGRPDLPSVSASARPSAAQPQLAAAQSGAPVAPPAQAPAGGAGGAPSLGSVDEMIERIAARLKANPGNSEDWRMLGWSYFGTERYAEAADAYGKAAALSPKNATLFASRAEALVRAAQGLITPEAKVVLETTAKLDPKEPRARFFLGMAKEQAGDKAAALADWIALVKESDPSEAWVPDLRQRIAELSQQMGVPVPAGLPALAPQKEASIPSLSLLKDAEPAAPAAKPAPAAASAQRGPTPEDVKAADALSAGDRNTMIRGMVDGLAARLEKSPRDAEGWIKLIRSRKVLGEDAAASQALKKALEIFADAAPERAQIVAAAMELQIKP